MLERRNIICCLPGLEFSNVWLANWTSLLSHLQSKYNVQVLFGYSNNIYITRNVMLEQLFGYDKAGVKLDLVLWMDDDNILTPEQFDLLFGGLEEENLDGILGWYWLQPHGYQIQPLVSTGLLTDKSEVEPIRPHVMYEEPMLQDVEYGGMGAFLVRWKCLKLVGEKSFAPIILPESLYGFSGDDISFFIRAAEKWCNFMVHKGVMVPHLKLRDVSFDSSQFVELPDEIKPALEIQGWMKPEELNWLYKRASTMSSVVEIGSWKGRSAYALSKGCKGMVYCIDHWKGASDLILSSGKTLNEEAKEHDIYAEFVRNVGSANCLAIKTDSINASDIPELQQVEMIFIDGSHEYDDVVKDLEAWEGKATKLLCGHDIDREDVKRALQFKKIPYKRGPGVIWYCEIEGIAA